MKSAAVALLVLLPFGGCRPPADEAPLLHDLIAAFPTAVVQPAPAAVGRRPPCPAAHVVPDERALFIPYGGRVDYRLRIPPGSVVTFTGPAPRGDTRAELQIVLQPDGEPERVLVALRGSIARQAVPLGGDASRMVGLSLRATSGAYPSPACGLTLRGPAVRGR